MGILDATKNYFLKWNDFKTRISRSEYWLGLLGIFLVALLFGFILGFVIAYIGIMVGASVESINAIINVVMVPWFIFNFISGLSLVARRFHDIDRSGWWYLIILTVIGVFVVLYWLCKKGDDGENRFGDNPLEEITAYSLSES